MKRDLLLYGIIGALIGGVVVWFLATNALNSNNMGMMRMMGMQGQNQQMMKNTQEMMMDSHDGEGMSMQAMTQALSGKTGDDFDKAFIDLMIEHHQGAIDMANEAKINAKHQEIKNLADDIISAQTNEINLMKDWQKTWAY